MSDGTLVSVDYKALSNQVTDKELLIGFIARQVANQLHQEGDITNHQLTMFYRAVREFLVHTCNRVLTQNGVIYRMNFSILLLGSPLRRE